jgi:type VI protein secretion system component Hcp
MTSARSRLSRVAIATALTALAAAPASAAGYMYFKDSPIVGESAGGKDRGRIEVDSWSWGAPATRGPDGKWVVVEREMKESGEKGGTEDINIGVGELQEAIISKPMDRSSPKLAQHALIGSTRNGSATRGGLSVKVPAGTCRVGARYPTAELGGGQRIYTMTGVVVTNCSVARSGDGSIPTETLSLNFDKISWKYWP